MKHVVAGCMLLVVLNLGFSYAYLGEFISRCTLAEWRIVHSARSGGTTFAWTDCA